MCACMYTSASSIPVYRDNIYIYRSTYMEEHAFEWRVTATTSDSGRSSPELGR